jgi:hypothetical protein
MTRCEMRARIGDEIGRRGWAAVLSSELWAAFAAPGEDPSLSFDDAPRGFAVCNGWGVRRDDLVPAAAFVFYPCPRNHPTASAATSGGTACGPSNSL